MPDLLFGTGGVPLSSEARSTISGINRIRELGLDCMEVEFVQGVTMGETTARQVSEEAKKLNVRLSVHAPYFINFNAAEPEKRRASRVRLLQSAHIGALCGARNIVFHAAFYLGHEPKEVYEIVKNELSEVLEELRARKIDVSLRPEITGKETQFGTVEETVRLCQELPGILPCLDVAHWHARTGAYNTYNETIGVLKLIESGLGKAATQDMHIHFSGIAYSKKGEIKHLPVKESDLNYSEILRAFKDFKIKGLVICESPNLEEDAVLLKESYSALFKKTNP